MAIYLTRKLRRDKLTQTGLDFSIKKYSSVSSVIGRVENRIKMDARLAKRVATITARIDADTKTKSQEQT